MCQASRKLLLCNRPHTRSYYVPGLSRGSHPALGPSRTQAWCRRRSLRCANTMSTAQRLVRGQLRGSPQPAQEGRGERGPGPGSDGHTCVPPLPSAPGRLAWWPRRWSSSATHGPVASLPRSDLTCTAGTRVAPVTEPRETLPVSPSQRRGVCQNAHCATRQGGPTGELGLRRPRRRVGCSLGRVSPCTKASLTAVTGARAPLSL